jgi:hypothetical protein
MDAIKIRRAPNGKFYAVWHGRPICHNDGNLRYFDSERSAQDLLQGCDLVLTAPLSVVPAIPASPKRGGQAREPLCARRVPTANVRGGLRRLSLVR